MTLAYIIWAVLVAIAAYCIWWERLFFWGKRPHDDLHPPLPYVLKFNAPIAMLAGYLAKSTGNYAVTLPHPFKRKCIVFVRRHYIKARHLAHEVDGHGRQICTMGPVDYTFTYLWHFILRKGTWALHMMEIEAKLREPAAVNHYPDIGTP